MASSLREFHQLSSPLAQADVQIIVVIITLFLYILMQGYLTN